MGLDRAPVAQLVDHRAVTQEVVPPDTCREFNSGQTNTRNDICKWLDPLVFSDKDDKPLAPSYNPSMFIILWDVKEPTHLSQRVGHVVPGVVGCLLWCIMVGRVNARRY